MKLNGLLVAASLALLPAMSNAQINFTPDFAGYSWKEVNNFFPNFGAIDMAYLPDGTYLVAQHAGIVTHWNDGTYLGQVLDIRDEVWSNGDAGLTAILVDPDFPTTPSIYLMYAVETQTDPENFDTVIERFGRITKYDLDVNNNYTAIPSTRKVLLGETWSEGILHESMFHATGGMEWGDDGTLLFTCGDAADFGYTPTTGLNIYGPGKFDPALNMRSLRAQNLDCYNAKISRIDRNTGLGLPTNPFYTGDPTEPKSKIWVYGLRNPWRFSVREGTGDHTSFGKGPGVIWIGDVGLDTYEEINITSKEGGENFGWPFYEGVISPLNPDTYNGPIPWVPVEETTTFSLAFAHQGLSIPNYPPDIAGTEQANSITAGFFYDYKAQDDFDESTSPVPYSPILDGKYMFAEWAQKGLLLTTVDELNQPTKVELMAKDTLQETFEGIVDLSYNPKTGDIYALTLWRIFRLEYDPAGGPPVTSVTATPDIGPLPLSVTLDASATYDPGNKPLSYAWDFDDTHTEITSAPVVTHDFTEDRNYTITMTAITQDNRESSSTVTIYAGNEPPTATILSPTDATTYPADGSPVTIHYNGTIADTDGAAAPTAKWRVALRHNDHRHELAETEGLQGEIDIRHEEENTFYLFELFATDDRGYTVKVEQEVHKEGTTAVENWSLYE